MPTTIVLPDSQETRIVCHLTSNSGCLNLRLAAAFREVVVDVAEMKPVTDDVKRWKLMGIGALGVAGIAAVALGVSLAEAIRRIVFVIIGKG